MGSGGVTVDDLNERLSQLPTTTFLFTKTIFVLLFYDDLRIHNQVDDSTKFVRNFCQFSAREW